MVKTPPMSNLSILALATGCVCLATSAYGDIVSTAIGVGADTEMREQDNPTASRNTAWDLNRIALT